MMNNDSLDVQEIMNRDNRLRTVEVLPQYRLRLLFSDGAEFVMDMSGWMNQGVMTTLQDPALFSQVAIGSEGRSLDFPGDIDFCADSLRVELEMLALLNESNPQMK